MANVKITDLSNYPVVLSSSSDVLPIVDVTNNITKKITVDNLFAGRGGGGGSGTVTSIGMTVPSGLNVSPNTPITTTGTFTLSWSPLNGIIPASALGVGASSTTFLRGDGQWVVPSGSGTSGTVTSVGLQLPSAFTISGTNPITTAGAFNVTWSTDPANKLPPVLLGGTPLGDPTTLYLRADGTWVNPVGSNVGTVTSVSVTVPTAQGLAITPLTPITTAGTFALSWSSSSKIPPTSLGTGLPTNLTFLRGDGVWSVPSLTPTSYQQISLLATLNAQASQGATQFTLLGNYTTELVGGTQAYFSGDGTQAYGIVSSAYNSTSNITTVNLGEPLAETHLVGADVYWISSGTAQPFTALTLGSNLTSSLSNGVLAIQGVPTIGSWLSGSQIPTSSQGTTGQNFFVTANNAIYTKTDYNTWTEQAPFEQVIDARSTTILTNNIGSTQVTTAGNGYAITYRLQVSAVTNLTNNVVIRGFKYISTTNQILSSDITLTTPQGGWTIGYYANFALALQLAVNALPNALQVTVTSDDANVQVTLVTAIPSSFLTPNPPTVASMTPTSVATGSFLSSLTIPVPASGGNPIQPATQQVASWVWNPSFQNVVQTYVDNEIDNYLETQNWFTATISPSFVYTLVSSNPLFYQNWNIGVNPPTIDGHSYIWTYQNVVNLFTIGQIITFSQSDQQGQQIIRVGWSGGATYIEVNAIPSGYVNTNSSLYFMTGGNGNLPAGTNTIMKWTPSINTLTNLSYNTSTGVFTNIATTRRRFTFSMEVGISAAGGATSNQADIWFQLNDTSLGSGSNRRGQKVSIYPTGTGISNIILSTSWTFSLNQNDTVCTLVWVDVGGSIGSNIYGNTNSARLTIIEV